MLSNRASFDEYEEEKEYSWDETRDWQTVLSPVSESDGDVPPPPASDHSSCDSTSSSSQTVVDCSSADDDSALLRTCVTSSLGSTNAANAAASVDVGRFFAVDKSPNDMSPSVSGLYGFDEVLEVDLGSSSSSSSSISCNDMDPLGNDTCRLLVVMRLFSLR